MRAISMKIVKDGNAYLIAADNFVDLQQSRDYFYIEEEEYKAFVSNITILAYGDGNPNEPEVKQALNMLLARPVL